MAAVPATSASRTTLQRLLCRSLSYFRESIPEQSHLACLDLSPSHLSFSISDLSQQESYPFGILCRTNSAQIDARILSSAFNFDNQPLNISGLVVGVSPQMQPDTVATYATGLLDALSTQGEPVDLFPNLKGVLFYSEAHALVRAIKSQQDYVQAIELIPQKLETRKRRRFEQAMNPKVTLDDIHNGREQTARISASEILQTVLDQLQRESNVD